MPEFKALSETPATLESLPQPLRETVQLSWRELVRWQDTEWVEWLQEHQSAVVQTLARSDFLAEQLVRHPEIIAPVLAEEWLNASFQPGCWQRHWERQSSEVDSEAALQKALRDFRRQAMFVILWRDLLGEAEMEETVASVSELADTAIDGALNWLYDDACQSMGTPMAVNPVTGESEQQRLVVLGMGKLGAAELNVSSDIDLIFAYPMKGETEGGSRSLDNHQFFTRLGQKLIQALDKNTVDGFVFRVDMRLRPYGQSGALALNFDALEAYYQDQGREWERYAMVKARVVAGDQVAGAELMEMLRPFVYRRYIDFSAFESLRQMKAMISREVRRHGLQNNIKLGPGGIREVEFIVQAFQLIRGGRDQELQERYLLKVLRAIGERELLPEEVVDELANAYVFLRDVEHAIQGIADRQTQTLPEDPEGRARLPLILGFDDWQAFSETLQHHRNVVSRHFADIITTDEGEEEQNRIDDGWEEIWQNEFRGDAAQQWLAEQGFEAPDQSLELLQALRGGRTVQSLQRQPRERLDQFMPVLLNALAGVDQPSLTLERVLQLVEAVLRRSAYFVLLNENPRAFHELVRLCSESPWIAEQLASTPLLLDELLNAESLYSPPAKDELRDELRQQLLRIPMGDLEEQMESLRHYKKAHVLRVAASELRGTLPLMKVSDYLTWIAEVVLDHVVAVAWHDLTDRYGTPTNESGEPIAPDFAVIGYGKFGGIELGYTSDLDLVFLHDSDPEGQTNGRKSIDNAVFYTRLGQRVVHILNTQTPSGQLYEVDMRLRPSGSAGLLVTTLASFEHYQRQEAWTWEHQALARARWVAGSDRTGQRFETLRHNLLCQRRDLESLRDQVVSMREKMRESLGTPVVPGREPEAFHIKQDPGGIIDIEFMVQYLLLAHAHEHPEITQQSDNIRQLEALGTAGILPREQTERLRDIFIEMRSTIHRRALQRLNSKTEPDAFAEERAYVRECWQQIMETGG